MVFKSSQSENFINIDRTSSVASVSASSNVTQTKYILLLSQPHNPVLGQSQDYTLNMTPIHCHGNYYSQPHTIDITLLEGWDLFARVHLGRLTPVFSEQVLDLHHTGLHFQCLTK